MKPLPDRRRRALAIAAALALWAADYALAQAVTAEDTLAREALQILGDLLGLYALALALITPWTARQRRRA